MTLDLMGSPIKTTFSGHLGTFEILNPNEFI